MSTSKQQQDDPILACEVCLQEIPESEAASDEASDYVRHYCGLECYQQWRSKQADNTED
jgi:hypothetical protein